MNRSDFINLLHSPKSEIPEIVSLEELVQRFPYCQGTQVLLAYQLFRKNDLGFHTQLRKAAAYTSSRARLRWMFKEEPISIKEEAAVMELPFEQDKPMEFIPAPVPVMEIEHEDAGSEKQRKLTLLDIVNKRLAEIEEEKRTSAQEKEALTAPKPLMSKEALIDKFIVEEPRISRPKIEFYSPSELAAKSNLDDEEIVSETLARLFSQQGNNEKAKHIYKKLSLLFPEKSSYFAALIEKLD